MSLTLIMSGKFTSTGAGVNVVLPGGADYFRAVNITQAATTQASGVGVEFEWFADTTASIPVGGALMISKTNSTNALNMSTVTTGGFTYIEGAIPNSAVSVGTTISQASSAVAAVTNTNSNGDRVRIYGVVGMRQISGMDFTVSSVSAAGYTLAGLNSAAFAAGATAFNVVTIAPYQVVAPEYLFITNISQAAQAVITVSTTHQYVAGMQIRLSVPSTYGMSQADGLVGTILSVGSYTITVDINSSGFSAWAWPTSAASINLPRFATLAPNGQKAYYDVSTATQYGYNVNQAPFRTAIDTPFMYLAAGTLSPAGSSADVIWWEAYRSGN